MLSKVPSEIVDRNSRISLACSSVSRSNFSRMNSNFSRISLFEIYSIKFDPYSGDLRLDYIFTETHKFYVLGTAS